MKRMLSIGGVIAALIAAVFGFVYFTPTGQDLVFSRLAKAVMSRPTESFDGLRVVICGSASPLGNDPNRAQACIAVVTPKHLLIFDVGARAPMRIAQAGLPLRRTTGVFITHFHSDHIAGLPDVNLGGWVQGRDQPLQVFGPMGIDKVVDGFNQAYALDQTYRFNHHGADLLAPDAGHMQAVTIPPGEIAWQDDSLTVKSFAVSHPPIEPAVGYRVDYKGRSVVISGDTNAVDSLFEIAEGADLLLHDALSRPLLDPMIKTADELDVPQMPQLMNDVIDYHADMTTLPERAKAANIQQLAYYHLVPVPANSLAERIYRRGLPDEVILVQDLHRFDLPANSKEIVITAP